MHQIWSSEGWIREFYTFLFNRSYFDILLSYFKPFVYILFFMHSWHAHYGKKSGVITKPFIFGPQNFIILFFYIEEFFQTVNHKSYFFLYEHDVKLSRIYLYLKYWLYKSQLQWFLKLHSLHLARNLNHGRETENNNSYVWY